MAPPSQRYFDHPLIRPETVEQRLYQRRIANEASKRNTLVILPTALGKTVVAALVAADILYQYRDAKILVMAPTRPLVMQHRASFLKFLKLRANDAVLVTGKTPPSHRRAVWTSPARLFLATPQVVRNDLAARRLSLEDYGLLVFDECHRAVKKYAYTRVAETYVAQARYPLILGMTASPDSNHRRILDVCRNLCIEQVEYRSEDDADVTPYIHPIEVTWRRVDLPVTYKDMKAQLRFLLNQRLTWLHRNGVVSGNPQYVGRRVLLEAGDELRARLEESVEEERPLIFRAIITQSLALTLFHALELLETQGVHALRAFLNKIEKEQHTKRSYAVLVRDPAFQKLVHVAGSCAVEHPKLTLLKSLLLDQVRVNPSSRTLIFAQYRDTVSHIVAHVNLLSGLRAERFVGQASKKEDKGLTQDEQADRVRMLRDGEVNVLVATSIAEEGLDIPAVDHVIFYEPIPSAIRYIQRRGRTGRKASGRVEILAANDTFDMIYLYASQKRAAKMRRVAADVNADLQPLIRKRARPTPNPMTRTDLEHLESDALAGTADRGTTSEADAVRARRREVDRATRRVYLRLLEEGSNGIDLNQLTSVTGSDEATRPVLKPALDKMVKEGYAVQVGLERYIASSAIRKADGDAFDVLVEKVVSGSAVVRINGEWRARLTHQDYQGPRTLIKKNSRFTAIGELYRTDGVLCLRVNAVTKVVR
jgi:Fanconi anemia group M protein